jgi:hypothetical protein
MRYTSLLLIASACLSTAFSQGIIEDTSAWGDRAPTAASSEEGRRYISPRSSYAVLKQKAAGGTAAFFVAVGVDLTASFFLMANPPKKAEETIPYLLVGLGVSACEMSSVPATCAQASGAVDVYREKYSYAHGNPAWTFYGLGWLFYSVGTVLNLVGSFSDSPQSAQIGSLVGLGGGVMWGVACIRSVTLINELAEKDATGGPGGEGRSLMIVPQVGPRGAVGLALSGAF